MKRGLIYTIVFILCIFYVDGSVVINEVMYNPNDEWEGNEDNYNEWIEIYNKNNESVDLTNWFLCNNNLISGYVNRSGHINLDTTMILEPNQYAIITDGGSGTEVYDNFDIDNNSLALHVNAASLCGDLGNKGDNITIKDSNRNILDFFNYTYFMGA